MTTFVVVALSCGCFGFLLAKLMTGRVNRFRYRP